MKIRIQDNSLRFRITLRELQQLSESGSLESKTQILGPDGPGPCLHHRIELAHNLPHSDVTLQGANTTLRLAPADLASLQDPRQEGVYLRRAWTDPKGTSHRFLAFVEKDRPGAGCAKPELWIYDAPPHEPVQTRPIPPREENS